MVLFLFPWKHEIHKLLSLGRTVLPWGISSHRLCSNSLLSASNTVIPFSYVASIVLLLFCDSITGNIRVLKYSCTSVFGHPEGSSDTCWVVWNKFQKFNSNFTQTEFSFGKEGAYFLSREGFTALEKVSVRVALSLQYKSQGQKCPPILNGSRHVLVECSFVGTAASRDARVASVWGGSPWTIQPLSLGLGFLPTTIWPVALVQTSQLCQGPDGEGCILHLAYSKLSISCCWPSRSHWKNTEVNEYLQACWQVTFPMNSLCKWRTGSYPLSSQRGVFRNQGSFFDVKRKNQAKRVKPRGRFCCFHLPVCGSGSSPSPGTALGIFQVPLWTKSSLELEHQVPLQPCNAYFN